MERELDHLKSTKREEIAEHLEYAKRMGDLSENAEYHQAREDQAMIEDRIRYIENLIKNAVIADMAVGKGSITIGSTVRLEKEGDNKSVLYTIVGSEEADTSRGKISNLSPLGSALIGHKKGEKVQVQTPKGKDVYTIAVIK